MKRSRVEVVETEILFRVSSLVKGFHPYQTYIRTHSLRACNALLSYVITPAQNSSGTKTSLDVAEYGPF